MTNRRRRSQIPVAPSPSTAGIRIMLTTLVSRHEEMKFAFRRLNSQIKTGLLEAEEVFTSLAIPLMKLVGLKTEEMADEGRFTTIIIDNDHPCGNGMNQDVTGSPMASSVASGRHHNSHITGFEAERYATKATMAGKELMDKQQTQFIQLIQLLKQIETQVNFRNDDILQTLANHQNSLQKLFQRAIRFICTFHGQNRDAFLITLKLLQAVFDNVGAVLSTVEDGVGNLMQDLAEKMCNPMTAYVKGLKDDIKRGTCARLLVTVKEMEGAIQNGRIELEATRKKAAIAEEEKMKALCKFRETEERLTRTKEHCGFLIRAKQEPIEPLVPHEYLGMEEDQAKVDKLMKRKRKIRTPESPMGPNELLYYKTNNKQHRPSEARALISHGPVTRSYSRGLVPQTPYLNARIPLGSSPTVAIQHLSRRITS
ncbi:putative JHL07K02.14 protein [Tripterygium wilfordii]|uniref:Putative JHL07K02.14 protein n=1 Tax=Tripterygium wilfordii TaxID=458696 RepID=A0A7J7DBI0_TRIWF|nr:uncharacterized protein LOC120004416 [Tripterygium wilfordii]KAF5743644.1 putative JHL07K02.14 protein [Tripterygium wilfordii]